MMKFLSSEIFPVPDADGDENEKPTFDDDSDSLDKFDSTLSNKEDDFAESEKGDDNNDEPSNFFELLHSNLAPSRRLKPIFFEPETLVTICFRALRSMYLYEKT